MFHLAVVISGECSATRQAPLQSRWENNFSSAHRSHLCSWSRYALQANPESRWCNSRSQVGLCWNHPVLECHSRVWSRLIFFILCLYRFRYSRLHAHTQKRRHRDRVVKSKTESGIFSSFVLALVFGFDTRNYVVRLLNKIAKSTKTQIRSSLILQLKWLFDLNTRRKWVRKFVRLLVWRADQLS